MRIKAFPNFVWFLIITAILIATFAITSCKTESKSCPPVPEPPNPLCALTSVLEEGSTCLKVEDPNSTAQYEAKVTLADKSELYCQLVKKQGLVCKPVKDSPETTGAKEAVRQIQQAQQQQSQAGSAAGSGSAAPPAKPPAK